MIRTLQTARPCSRLRQYVRSYAQREIHTRTVLPREAIPPRLEQTLEFQFGGSLRVAFHDGRLEDAPRAVVVGLNTQRADIILDGAVETFAIFFQPMGFSQLFKVPARELSNRYFEAASVMGKSADILAAKLASHSFTIRVRIADDFLLSLAINAPAMDLVAQAARRIFLHRGDIRISELAQHCGLGLRQFERRFQNGIGIEPKLFARVARFQMALDAKIASPGLSWLLISHELGYHDQMHMIREFRSLGGGAPNLLAQQIVDGRPPAIMDALLESAK